MSDGPIENEPSEPSPGGTLLGDLVRLYVEPEALFAALPVVNRGAAALWLLLGLYALQAALLLSTGVHDYEIDRQTQRKMAREAERLPGDENADELVRNLEAMEKQAVFDRMLNRLLLLIGGPLRVLVGVIVVAALLYAVVALRGTARADFALLAGVAVFAAWTQVPRLLLLLFLVPELGATRIETSAAAFVSAPQTPLGTYLLLRRLDPFDVWYWLLVGLGAWKTGQLPFGRAVVATCGLALLSTLFLLTMDFQNLADMTQVWQSMQEETNP